MPSAAAAEASVAATSRKDTKQPLYKRWWLWTAVGGVVVAGAVVGAVLATSLRPTDPFSGQVPDARVPLTF